MNRRSTLTFFLAAAAGGLRQPLAQEKSGNGYLARDDVRQYIDEIVAAHGFDRGWVERVFSEGRYSELAERLNTPSLQPPSARNWIEYRARNVDERRVREGIAFRREHRGALLRAAALYGVPDEIIVAIIGIETHYGRLLGNLRTVDVMLTLAFDYTRRAPLYRAELVELLLLAREQGIDPLSLRGSFAGAIGLPQFMPSSIRRWATDFDGDGRVELARSPVDAIGSVGNFLAVHGWQPGVPVQAAVQADESIVEVLGRGGIQAMYRWRDVVALGVVPHGDDAAIDGEARVLLLDLPYLRPDGSAAYEYRVGTVNATALLHYNRSYFYAVAVAELAAAIRARAETA